MNGKDEIIIEGVGYRLGYNLRVRMIYERLTGKMIGEEMMTFENVVYFYSILLAFNKDTFKYDLEAFVDLLTEHEEIYGELMTWVMDYWKRRSELYPSDGTDDGKKKE